MSPSTLNLSSDSWELDMLWKVIRLHPFNLYSNHWGLEFSLRSLQHGYFMLQHTESRRSELVSAIDGLLAAQRTTAKELERLHGRLVWFNSFVFGRLMNHAVKIISTNCHSNSKYVSCGTELKNGSGSVAQDTSLLQAS